MLVRASVVIQCLTALERGRREEGGRGEGGGRREGGTVGEEAIYLCGMLSPIGWFTREPVTMVTENHQILRSSVLVCRCDQLYGERVKEFVYVLFCHLSILDKLVWSV